MTEVWKPIQGYEGWYEISNFGNVRSVPREVIQNHWQGGVSVYKMPGRTLKPGVNPNGYCHIDLHRNGKIQRFSIHRLVAIHFIENPCGYPIVNHIDADPSNNRADNLEWCTQSHNIQHAYDNGTKEPPHQKKIYQLTEDGKIIREFKNIAAAHRETGVNNIGAVLRGLRNQSGGYRWRYAQ